MRFNFFCDILDTDSKMECEDCYRYDICHQVYVKDLTEKEKNIMPRTNVERRVTSNIKIEDARLIFKNFQGKANNFNAEGNRNFGVILDEELADQLSADGWKVRRLKPREGDDREQGDPWLPVKVKYGDYPPIAVLITSRGKTKLDEETIGQLDWTVIKTVDLIIRPYNYPPMNGRPGGVSAYLKSIYVTVNEDDLEIKYADLPYAEDE